VGAIIASDESEIAPMRAARENPVLNLAAILFPIEGMQEAADEPVYWFGERQLPAEKN
jgi:hypothetical protein